MWKRTATVAKWIYVCVSEVIGWAGVPEDISAWGGTMSTFLQWLDSSWLARATLVISGLIVLVHLFRSWQKYTPLSDQAPALGTPEHYEYRLASQKQILDFLAANVHWWLAMIIILIISSC